MSEGIEKGDTGQIGQGFLNVAGGTVGTIGGWTAMGTVAEYGSLNAGLAAGSPMAATASAAGMLGPAIAAGGLGWAAGRKLEGAASEYAANHNVLGHDRSIEEDAYIEGQDVEERWFKATGNRELAHSMGGGAAVKQTFKDMGTSAGHWIKEKFVGVEGSAANLNNIAPSKEEDSSPSQQTAHEALPPAVVLSIMQENIAKNQKIMDDAVKAQKGGKQTPRAHYAD
jgi:hypothetical protein